MWAGNLNLYILRSNGMEWRFSLYFSLLTSERSRDKPGRRSPEGVGGGGWRGRRRGLASLYQDTRFHSSMHLDGRLETF